MRDGGQPPRLGELGREGGVAPGKPQEDTLDGVEAASGEGDASLTRPAPRQCATSMRRAHSDRGSDR